MHALYANFPNSNDPHATDPYGTDPYANSHWGSESGRRRIL